MTADIDTVAAKAALVHAINLYYQTITPGVYVESWMLLTHKLSTEMEQAGTTSVGILTATGQSFVTTRGLLEIALDSERQ